MREDWIECKLGEILTVSSGKGLSASKMEAGKFPVYGGNGISGYHSHFLFEDIKLIIGRVGAKCGVVHITQTNSWVTDNALVVNFKFKIPNLKFFKLLLEIENLNKLSNSTAQPVISGAKIYEYDILLPSLPEQRAIVKKLESLFSSLDAGVADLKKAQQQLKIYRQAVLKKAFEGELTNLKIENLVPIGQRVIVNPRPPKEGFDDDIECQFVPMKLVEALINKIHLEETAVFSTLKGKSYTYFETGDVIFAKVTPCMENGKIAVAKDLKNGVALGSSEFHVFRCNEELLNEYLFYFIIQDKFRSEAERAMTGAVGLRRVPKKFIEDYLIPLPAIKEQKEIVKQIESRLSVCDFIQQNIKEGLKKAEALRQSILKKAFEGNLLTAQELAACKQAADYEPAGVLLERIKAQQNKATAKPSKKKVAQPSVVAKTETPVAKISADIHAGLIVKVIKIHEENPTSIDNLSHIKCEKIAHLVEYHLQIPLGRQPVKDAAGPDDYPHLKKIEHRAKMANYFAVQKKDIGYSYSSAKNSDKAIEKIQSSISFKKNKQLDDLIALFLNFDLEVSEIIATTYAGWNNLILTGNANPSDEEIVYESRENWSERKLKIARERFFKAIEWLRKNEIVPTGYGDVVPFPKKKKS
ncbi:restriction endonuclease subunit S [Pedobacter roseus]|uniref:Restriction endonuclease subunit S n=1 Tax=Pedobacter roseus TaxID=336820 RepID=A0A7G9QJX1_9SPHI|nr:restriction endonuclease subunit S [Pedobacter roseus]QNN43646.1 restriction endonuclease subunit S [Pedobacter roseus]